jgi:pimeloyl-ACP methyl ester carboxylesterase
MPKVNANHLTINYDQQGSGEPLVLIPYLAADHACYAYQVAEYAKHFTCYTLDPRGAGDTEKPAGPYSIELFADDVAAFMDALGIAQAHVSGLSLGAAIGMWLAAKYPAKVKTLSLHSPWTRTDRLLGDIVRSWQLMARGGGSVADVITQGIFPWCFTVDLYVEQPEVIQGLTDFVRSRPAQPVDAFLRQSDAVLAHDVEARLERITAPTQITFGREDRLTSTRFADRLKAGVRAAEVVVFDGAAHAAIYERTEEFNRRTLEFLTEGGKAGRR